MTPRKYKGSLTVYPKHKTHSTGIPFLNEAFRKVKKLQRQMRINELSRPKRKRRK
jgi:hypothetical protein